MVLGDSLAYFLYLKMNWNTFSWCVIQHTAYLILILTPCSTSTHTHEDMAFMTRFRAVHPPSAGLSVKSKILRVSRLL